MAYVLLFVGNFDILIGALHYAQKGTLEPAGNLGDALLQLAANDSGVSHPPSTRSFDFFRTCIISLLRIPDNRS